MTVMQQWRERAQRYFFGHDVFISYARADATPYAAAIAATLTERNIAVRIDQWGAEPGPIPHSLLLEVKRSAVFLLISSDAALQSDPVAREIEARRDSGRPIVLVDLHGSVGQAKWWPLVRGLHVSLENADAAAGAPSGAVIEKIVNTIGFNRRDRRQRRATRVAATVVLGLTALAFGLGGFAWWSAAETRRSRAEVSEAGYQLGVMRRLSGKARIAANDARDDAARAKGEAAEQTLLKDQAIADRTTAEARTHEAVLRKLESDGRRLLEERPDAAIHLAFEAARMTDDLAPVRLLRDAVAAVPIWFEAVPGGATRDSWHLSGLAGPGDVVATDPAMSRVVAASAAGSSRIELRRVPDGKRLSTLTLGPGQRFLTPDPATTTLVAVARESDGHIILYDLTGDGFTRPVAKFENCKTIAFTRGEWPVYVLARDGTVTRHERGPVKGATIARDLGRWPDVQRLYPFPDPERRAVAIRHDAGFSIATAEGAESIRRDVEIPDVMGMMWGPDPQKIVVVALEQTGENGVVYAASGDELRKIAQVGLGVLVNETFLRARSGKRLVITGSSGGEGAKIEVLDLDWKKDGTIAATRRASDWFEHGVRRTNTSSLVDAAAISEDGNFLVVARESFGISGTPRSSAAVELWQLNALERGSTLAPVAVELKKGDSSPASRLAFSADGSRILVWDENHVSTIYRMPFGPSGLKTRIEPAVESFGSGLRFRRVAFSPVDWRCFDVVTGKEIELEPLAGGAPILDVAIDPATEAVTLATERELVRAVRGSVVARRKVGRILRASTDGEIAVAQTPDAIVVHDARTLQRMHTIPLDASFVPTTVRASRSGDLWVYAEGDDILRSWRFPRSGGPRETREIRFEVPAKRHETRFFPLGHLLIVQVAQLDDARLRTYDPFLPAPITFYDLRRGGEQKLESPEGLGWPTGYGSLMDVFVAENGEITLVLRYRKREARERMVAAVWSADGRFLRHSVIPFSGKLKASDWRGNDAYLLLESDAELAYVRVRDGRIVWRSADERHRVVPPALTMNAGGWQAQDDSVYRTLRKRILMGGADSPRLFTYTSPPRELIESRAQAPVRQSPTPRHRGAG